MLLAELVAAMKRGPYRVGEPEDESEGVWVMDASSVGMTADEIVSALNAAAPSVQQQDDPRIAKIEALRNLPANWNSYGAEPMNKSTIDTALALCSAIPAEFSSIIPIAGGGVMFGKNGDEVTIEVYAHEEPTPLDRATGSPVRDEQIKPEGQLEEAKWWARVCSCGAPANYCKDCASGDRQEAVRLLQGAFEQRCFQDYPTTRMKVEAFLAVLSGENKPLTGKYVPAEPTEEWIDRYIGSFKHGARDPNDPELRRAIKRTMSNIIAAAPSVQQQQQEATEAMVKAGAEVISTSPCIVGPFLPAPCWMGLAREVIEAALLAEAQERPWSEGVTEQMADSVRGVLQLIRNKPGATFHDVRLHCEARGDEFDKWPEWIFTTDGYVTEQSAATMIYQIMRNQLPEPPSTRES